MKVKISLGNTKMGKIPSVSLPPNKPDEDKIKGLLLDCLEMQYGKLNNVFEHGINIQSELQKITDAVNIIQSKIK